MGSQSEPSWYCLEYAKTGRTGFLSHLDLLNILERALRRSGLPLFWKLGFRPRPRLSFGQALPLGFESQVEVMAIALAENLPCRQVEEQVSGQLPEGLQVQRVYRGRDVSPPDEQEWRLLFPEALPAAEVLKAKAMAIGTVEDQRGRTLALAAALQELSVTGRELKVVLATPGGRGLRPDLLAKILELGQPEKIEKMTVRKRSTDIQENKKENNDTQTVDQRGRPGRAPDSRRGKR